jgi:formyltetrahydrofolate deformylase
VSHEDLSRTEHEEQVRAIIDGYQPDYVILAKYMRVLTPSFVEAYPRKIINIHTPSCPPSSVPAPIARPSIAGSS